MESHSPDRARVRSANARVAASSCVRISERKRTARAPDNSNRASSNSDTQRNNQRSLLEGGVGSRHASGCALSLNVAIKSAWGKQLHYPSRRFAGKREAPIRAATVSTYRVGFLPKLAECSL